MSTLTDMIAEARAEDRLRADLTSQVQDALAKADAGGEELALAYRRALARAQAIERAGTSARQLALPWVTGVLLAELAALSAAIVTLHFAL